MRVDERVVRRLYERETKNLAPFTEALRARGCFVIRQAFPEVDFLLVSSKPITPMIAYLVPTPSGQPQQLQIAQGAPVFGLSARSFVARVSLDDYDLRAPSVQFLDPASLRALTAAELAPAAHLSEAGVLAPVLIDGHPNTSLPFLCMPGVREYHEHPEHSGDDWLQYRSQVGLLTTILTVIRTCIEIPDPCVAMNATLGKSNILLMSQGAPHVTP